ncbi:hypothetical protein D3C72_1302540 [compost metagenome]
MVRGNVLGVRQRDPDAHADGHGVAGDLERLAHRVDQAFGHPAYIALVADVGQHHGELVSAQPRQRVLLAQMARQALGQQAQQFVAALVAQGVVDALEVVQVQAQHRRGAVAASVQGPEQPVAEQPAVGHARQRIVVRHVADLRVGGVLVGDVVRDQQHIARARVAAVKRQGLGAQGAGAARRGQFLFLFAHGAVRA